MVQTGGTKINKAKAKELKISFTLSSYQITIKNITSVLHHQTLTEEDYGHMKKVPKESTLGGKV